MSGQTDYFSKQGQKILFIAVSFLLSACADRAPPTLQNAAPFDQPKTLQYSFHIPLGFEPKN